MIGTMQIIGVAYALTMCYITRLYYKRKNYPRNDYIVWTLVWALFLALTLFPAASIDIIDPLRIDTVHLFTIAVFSVMLVILFFQHVNLRKNQEMVETLVREITNDRMRKNYKDK